MWKGLNSCESLQHVLEYTYGERIYTNYAIMLYILYIYVYKFFVGLSKALVHTRCHLCH